MKKHWKVLLLFVTFAFLVSFMVACNSNEQTSNNNDNGQETNNQGEEEKDDQEVEKDPDPVTIKWGHQWGEEHFWDNYGDLLKDKFPHVTIEVLEVGTDHTETLEEAMAGGSIPDVLSMSMLTHTNFLINLELAYDHYEIIEKTGFDLSRLEPTIVQYAENRDPERSGKLYIIPNGRPTWALHYNMDVFDILGVDYPEDGMTWDEVVELAKDLTREVNGIQYYGLDLDVPYDAWTQLNVQAVDPDTEEVIIANSEGYKRFFQMIYDTINIPGYPEGGGLMNWGGNFGEGNWAMRPAGTGFLEEDHVNIATYPVWDKDNPLMPLPNSGGFAITAPSEHKEVVMEMIAYLLSDEVQMEKSRDGQSSILVNPDVHAVFGENKPEWEGKNLDALFKFGYASGVEKPAKYGSIPWGEFAEFANSGMDVNEYLRVYQENMEELVRQQKERE